ncbi:MAG: hypothetical protein QXK54_03585 [Ignisphaera sp.]
MKPRGKILYVLSAVILVTIAIVFTIFPSSPIFHTNDANSYVFRTNLRDLAKEVSFYHVEYLSPKFLRLLNNVGLDVAVKQLDRDKAVLERSLVFVHSERVAKNLPWYTELLTRILSTCRKCAVAYLNMDPKVRGLEAVDSYSAVLKALGSIGVEPIIPLSPDQPVNNDKLGIGLIHPVLESADMIVFTADPPGLIIVESLSVKDFHIVLGAVLEWSKLLSQSEIPPEARIPHQSIISGPTNMLLLGYIGWITNSTYGRGCGEETGRQYVYIRYYYGNVTAATGATYHVWYVYTMHAGVGFKTTCIWQTYNHYPRLFETTIHWRTDTWPGQVLDDWQPRGIGSTRSVQYTISGINNAKVSVSYSIGFTEPETPYFTIADYTDPDEGRVRVRHWVERGNFSESSLSNLVFTVEPSSFGFLDSEKPGGNMPMIVLQSFYMELNTGDSINITFQVALRNTS